MNSQQATEPVRKTVEDGKVNFHPLTLSVPQGLEDTVTCSLLPPGKTSALPSTD